MDEDRVNGETLRLYGVPFPKIPIVRRPEYTIFFEQSGPTATFVHVHIERYGPTVRARMLADFDQVLQLHGGPLFVYCKTAKSHLRKLAVHLGFSHALDLVDNDGDEAEILVKIANPAGVVAPKEQ